jgi:hypothetical protein
MVSGLPDVGLPSQLNIPPPEKGDYSDSIPRP